MSKELQIRNSTVDFLVFTRDAGEDGIEVRVQNGSVFCSGYHMRQSFREREQDQQLMYITNVVKKF